MWDLVQRDGIRDNFILNPFYHQEIENIPFVIVKYSAPLSIGTKKSTTN
jgi:hypothetical protein